MLFSFTVIIFLEKNINHSQKLSSHSADCRITAGNTSSITASRTGGSIDGE